MPGGFRSALVHQYLVRRISPLRKELRPRDTNRTSGQFPISKPERHCGQGKD